MLSKRCKKRKPTPGELRAVKAGVMCPWTGVSFRCLCRSSHRLPVP